MTHTIAQTSPKTAHPAAWILRRRVVGAIAFGIPSVAAIPTLHIYDYQDFLVLAAPLYGVVGYTLWHLWAGHVRVPATARDEDRGLTNPAPLSAAWLLILFWGVMCLGVLVASDSEHRAGVASTSAYEPWWFTVDSALSLMGILGAVSGLLVTIAAAVTHPYREGPRGAILRFIARCLVLVAVSSCACFLAVAGLILSDW